ncbi:MAG: BamA/TamA family outer membrane protein, partial [Flavobacteriaceae bacterium]|nr:BamA/TamA family outer membrane protein [Flavobacteriaceae bacterium]
NGFSIISEYDNLNNSLSPTNGMKIHFGYNQNLEILGGRTNWGKLSFYSHFYVPVSEKWIPAFRIESNLATGNPPFYAYPYIKLRGIPALRYQAELTVLAETEQLYNINQRWGIVGFTGMGAAISSVDETISNEFVWNAGAGVRYVILKDLGIKVGTDLARGPEAWAFYVSVGSSW